MKKNKTAKKTKKSQIDKATFGVNVALTLNVCMFAYCICAIIFHLPALLTLFLFAVLGPIAAYYLGYAQGGADECEDTLKLLLEARERLNKQQKKDKQDELHD